MKLTRRRIVLLISGLLAAALVAVMVAGVIYLWLPSRKIAEYQQGYEQIGKGASKQQVFGLMGKPTRTGGLATEYWDWEKLDSAETNRISETVEYTVPTFSLSVKFTFSFDTNNLLVGKHRYD